MQNIQQVTIWNNGQLETATQLEVVSVYDDLATTADFRYTLFTADKLMLASDRLTISGEDYTAWGASPDINHAAYAWVAGKLNLTLDYASAPEAEQPASVEEPVPAQGE